MARRRLQNNWLLVPIYGCLFLSNPPDDRAQKIYWSDEFWGSLHRADLDGRNLEMVSAPVAPHMLAIDPEGGWLYWSDRRANRIQRGRLEGGPAETLIWRDVSVRSGIALDPPAGKLYWTTSLGVHRANMDGSAAELLIGQTARKPILADSIAIDTLEQKIFWVDLHDQNLKRANLADGTGIETLLRIYPSTLALDVRARKIYWPSFSGVYRANLDGTNVETVISVRPGPLQAFALDGVRAKVYWATRHSISRANLDGSGVEELYSAEGIYAQHMVIDEKTGVLYWGSGGPRFRRWDPAGAEPHPIEFDSRWVQGPLAIGSISRMLYCIDADKIVRSRLDGSEIQTVIPDQRNDLYGFALDSEESTIYWTLRHKGLIQRANIDGSNVEPVLKPVLGFPSVIVPDGQGDSLYWLEPSANFVRVRRAKLADGRPEDVVMTAMSEAAGLAVAPQVDRVCWGGVFRDAPRPAGRIQCARLDGSEITDLVILGDFRPLVMAFDSAGEWLYWIATRDTVQGRRLVIQRARWDGTNIEKISSKGLSRPIALAVDPLEEKVYWADLGTNRITRINFDGSRREVVVEDRWLTGFGIDLQRRKLYWGVTTPGSYGLIRRANLDGLKLENVLGIGRQNYPDALVFDEAAQEFFWRGSSPLRIQRCSLSRYDVRDFVANPFALPRSIAVDSADGKLYWGDDGIVRELRRANVDGTMVEIAAQTDAYPTHLVMDEIGRRIYWSDGGYSSLLKRMSLEGKQVQSIGNIRDGRIGSLAVDPFRSKLYWSAQGDWPDRVIRIANVDGTDAQPFFSSPGIRPQSLAIDFGPHLTGSEPANCAVDPRMPRFAADALGRLGWGEVEIRFTRGLPGLTMHDLRVTGHGHHASVLSILGVVEKDSATYRVQFSSPIDPESWTCVHHIASGTKTCIGALPGDVDGDRVVRWDDVVALTACVGGEAQCEIWECDIDRSGVCDSRDVTREIDLLNGADGLEPWLGAALPECP